MKMPFAKDDIEFFRSLSDNFELERDGQIIEHRVKGNFGKNQTIQVLDDYDIQEGDVLIFSSKNKRCFVTEVVPISEVDFEIHYQTELQIKHTAQQAGAIHINHIAGNAIVGSQQNASINVGMSFDEIRRLIGESKNIEPADEKRLNEFVDAVEVVIKNNMSVTKGTFSNFSDLVERYAPIVGAIVHPLTAWLLGK